MSTKSGKVLDREDLKNGIWGMSDSDSSSEYLSTINYSRCPERRENQNAGSICNAHTNNQTSVIVYT